jgi:hypothetical protein
MTEREQQIEEAAMRASRDNWRRLALQSAEREGEAINVLRSVEWSLPVEDGADGGVCPVCGGYRDAGWHNADCRLAALVHPDRALPSPSEPDRKEER